MGPIVRSLILKGFRSVSTTRVDFDNPTFLVGKNGSGKSNIVDAFAFLADAMELPLPQVFDRRGGLANIVHKAPGGKSPANLGIAVECALGELPENPAGKRKKHETGWGTFVNARYAIEIRPLSDFGFEIVREQCVLNGSNGNKRWFDRKLKSFRTNVEPFAGWTSTAPSEGLAIPFLADAFADVFQILRRMRVYSIEPRRLRRMHDPDKGACLDSDGENAASVLEEIRHRAPGDVRRIEEFLSAIVPDVKSVSSIRYGKKLALQFTQGWDKSGELNFEAFNMSDGTLRALGLLLAVFQRETPSVIVVEEPEASIHPGAAGVVLDLLRHASTRMQVLVSTHSPDILDASWIEDKHLRVVNWHNGVSSVSGVSEMSKKALREHLMGAGELFRSEALESDALFEDVEHLEPSLFEEVS